MKAEFGKHGPKHDYRGAQVVSSDGKLWDIIDVYRHDVLNVTMARVRSFNREHEKEWALATLDILERTYENAD